MILKMNAMDPNNKKIWEAAYNEEYDGLQNLPTRAPILESEHREINHMVGNALPTMAISTIKYDENRAPK